MRMASDESALTTNDLIKFIASQNATSYEVTKLWVDAVLDGIYDLVIDGEIIKLYRLGTVGHKPHHACYRTDFHTKERVFVPEYNVPAFQFSDTFRREFRKKYPVGSEMDLILKNK